MQCLIQKVLETLTRPWWSWEPLCAHLRYTHISLLFNKKYLNKLLSLYYMSWVSICLWLSSVFSTPCSCLFTHCYSAIFISSPYHACVCMPRNLPVPSVPSVATALPSRWQNKNWLYFHSTKLKLRKEILKKSWHGLLVSFCHSLCISHHCCLLDLATISCCSSFLLTFYGPNSFFHHFLGHT